MHVALLTNNVLPPREGIGQHVLAVATGLAARGHRVTVLARGEPWCGWSEGAIGEVRVRRYPYIPVPPLHHKLARDGLRQWLADGADGAELLHVHLPLLPPLETRLPIAVTVHSPMLTDSAAITESGVKPFVLRAQARLLSRRLELGWFARSRCIIAVSQGVRRELEGAYGLPGASITVIPNGVDAAFFAPSSRRHRRTRIVYVGRLAVRKGLGRLLAAFAALGDRDAELVLVGEGPLATELARQAGDLGIEQRVRFTGFLDRNGVRAELRGASVFVNPADYETGPLTLLEAMACGTPVVSTATGLAREFGDEPPITLVAPDAEALAAGLRRVLSAPDEAAAAARRARDLVLHRHGWDRIVDALELAYGTRARLAA